MKCQNWRAAPLAMLMKTGVGLLVAMLCSAQLSAAVGIVGAQYRNLQFDHLTTDTGLSQDMINDIVQDRRGYIWIATQEGLNRYDGYEIVHYEHLQSDPNTLSHDFIRSLLIDRDNVLWAATKRGVNRYDEVADRFIHVDFLSADGRNLKDDEVRTMMQTHDGAFWFGTQRNGLLRADLANNVVQRFQHEPDNPASLPSDSVLALLEDSIGNVWIGTENAGLSRYDPVANRFVRYDDQSESGQSVPGNEVRSIYEDRSGMLWIGTGDAGLSRFDLKRGSIENFAHEHDDPHSIPTNRIYDIMEDVRGALWIATDSGLSQWQAVERGFLTYVHRKNDHRSLVDNRINKLYADASGVLWLGTWDGVSRWNYFSDTFSYYRSEDGSLAGNLVTSIAESTNGTLWVATYGTGLTRIDPLSGAVRIFRNDPEDPGSLPSDRVMAVHVDREDQVWIGTQGRGIALLDPAGTGFVRYEHDPEDPYSLSGNKITSLHTDSRGGLWVGTFGSGLNHMPAGAPGEFKRYSHDPNDPTTISGDRVLNLYGDRSGNIWVGADRAGLNRFSVNERQFTRFQEFELPDGGALILDTPMDLVEDRDGSLWIGTLGQGLLRWNANERHQDHALVDVFSKAEGLPADTVFGVLEEGSGALWLSSNRGLTRFDVKGGVRQFDSRNGLRDREFMQGSRLRSRSGRLLFGGISGVVSFFPGDLPVNSAPPKIVAEAHSRQERLAVSVSGDVAAQIEVGYLDRFLSFDFVALDFTSPDKNLYRYRLEGFDEDWVEGDGFRRATYTNLTPGRYTFLVEGANNDGLWNRDPAAIGVRVIPAPWSTWWAYLGYFSIVAVLIGVYLRSHRGKLQREAQQRESLEDQVSRRTQELAERNAQLESLNGLLAEASVTDSLTGLKNRRYLDQFVSEGVSLADRLRAQVEEGNDQNAAQIIFFMMIDLDDFKLINDRFGHQAGDQVLIQVKDVLEASSRTSDVLIRWGGDEFMMIGAASSASAVKVLAERIRAAVDDLVYDAGNGTVGLLSASIGVATFALISGRTPFSRWEQVVGIADRAAYVAKSNGRNAWVCVCGAENLESVELSEFSERLEALVESERVTVFSSLSSRPLLLLEHREQSRRMSG